jgi:hypothetical protein
MDSDSPDYAAGMFSSPARQVCRCIPAKLVWVHCLYPMVGGISFLGAELAYVDLRTESASSSECLWVQLWYRQEYWSAVCESFVSLVQ